MQLMQLQEAGGPGCFVEVSVGRMCKKGSSATPVGVGVALPFV